MAPTLILPGQRGMSKSKDCRILAVQFGDGYEERSRDGINTIRSNWRIEAVGLSDQEADDLDALLTEWAGVTAFHWDKDGAVTTRLYTCDRWTFTYLGPNAQTLSAEFKEEF